MSNQDLAQSVNAFMLTSAPTLIEASPMAYDLLKSLARQLLFKVKTTSEHAEYVMGKKYSHIYASSVISTIIDEAADDEMSERVGVNRTKREKRRLIVSHPTLLAV